MNDSKITLDKLIDNNISTKENQETYQSRETKPDTTVTYVAIVKIQNVYTITKQKWIII